MKKIHTIGGALASAVLATAGIAAPAAAAVAAHHKPAKPVDPGKAAATCFWTGPGGVQGDPVQNYAYPDFGARYWFSAFTMPAGATVVFDGEFQHGRYQSLNSYDGKTAAPTDALNDAATVPNKGSSNPFLPRAKRTVKDRSYTAYVVDQAPPADRSARATNTLYAGVPGQQTMTLIYRTYINDQGTDDTGDVGLLRPKVRLADGTVVTGADACDTLTVQDIPILPVTSMAIPSYDALRNPAKNRLATRPGFPGFEDPVWRASYSGAYNVACTYREQCGGTPVRNMGQYSNIDNQYANTYVSHAFGDVLVLRGKLPRTPQTRDGDRRMDAKVDMRYWSMCANETYVTTRAVDCLYDEEIATDKHGWYTIVMTRPEDRPRNVDPKHGMNWLPMSPDGDGLCTLPCNTDDTYLLIRNMMPNPTFTHAVQNTKVPGDEKTVMGHYLPTGDYMSLTEFAKTYGKHHKHH